MKITQEILDAHALDLLNDQDRAQLEIELSRDKNLKEEVELHEYVIHGLDSMGIGAFRETVESVEEGLDQSGFFSDESEKTILDGIESIGRDKFKSMLEEVENQLETDTFFEETAKPKSKKETTKVINMTMRRVFAIAASVLLLTAAGLWLWQTPSSDTDLYEVHFATITENLSTSIDAEIGEIGFAESEKGLLTSLKESMILYNSGEYEVFLTMSEQFLNLEALGHYQEEILLYQGVALMELNRFGQAFDKLNSSETTSFEKDWYMSLIMIRRKEYDKARDLLSTLDVNKSGYDVSGLLERLK